MHVAVGSTNPVKVGAAEVVLHHIYGEAVRVTSLNVQSGVSPQPWGDEETRRGALNRAAFALRHAQAEWGIGFEGGVVEVTGELYTTAWCAVMRNDGVVGTAGGGNLLLPPPVVRLLREGYELGVVMDGVTGEHNTRQQGGAIGAFTQGYLDRQRAFEHLLILALARFLMPSYYD